MKIAFSLKKDLQDESQPKKDLCEPYDRHFGDTGDEFDACSPETDPSHARHLHAGFEFEEFPDQVGTVKVARGLAGNDHDLVAVPIGS